VAGAEGNVYVANGFSQNLSVISPTTNRVVATIPGFTGGPAWLAYDATGGRLYVGDIANRVRVVTTATESVADLPVIANGPGPMAIDEALGELALVSGGTNVTPALVHAISLTTGEVESQVYAGPIQPFPSALTFDSATGTLYVLNPQTSNVTVVGPYPVTVSTSGLPTGVTCAISLTSEFGINRTLLTHGPPVTFYVPNGSYRVSATIPPWYASASSSGSVHVSGLPVSHTVSFGWSTEYWAWLVGGSASVVGGGFLALRWRGRGKSALRREYEAIFLNDMSRRPKE
jgi:YVTN family beta-propeller protein